MLLSMRNTSRALKAVFYALSLMHCLGHAAPGGLPTAPVTPAISLPAVPAAKAEVHPYWTELTVAQQTALAPLQSEWSKIDIFRKKKWLQISSRYASMKPDEQQRLQDNMRVWAKLSPDQRRHAREVYSRTKSLDAEQKSAQWQEYQSLPETEKKRLAKDISAKKHVTALPPTPVTPSITPPKVLGGSAVKAPATPATNPTTPAASSVPAANALAVPAK